MSGVKKSRRVCFVPKNACAKMNISRGTFQRILYAERKQVAYALINGHGIEISGGNYQIADSFCGYGAQCEQCMFRRGE